LLFILPTLAPHVKSRKRLTTPIGTIEKGAAGDGSAEERLLGEGDPVEREGFLRVDGFVDGQEVVFGNGRYRGDLRGGRRRTWMG